MTINKFNYEAFALDYLEGNLSPEMVEEMELFLKTHPAIESELSGMMEFVTLEADESITYEDKMNLLKPERVIWLQKRWIRPLLAVASIALLLMTYFVGYQAGVNKGEQPGIVAINKIEETKKVIKAIKTPIKGSKENQYQTSNKEINLENTIAKNNHQPSTTILNQVTERPSVSTEPTVVAKSETRNNLTEKIPVLIINPLPISTNEVEKAQMEELMTNVLTTLAATNLMNTQLRSISVNDNDLTNILAAELPLDKAKLAKQLKRKRTFKDFLGKFPVNNLKEALIPSYYREEAIGQ